MNMGKRNKCNLKEDKNFAEVVKNANICMIKVFPDTEKYKHGSSKSSASFT